MSNDNVHVDMRDELAGNAVLANMVPAPAEGTPEHRALVQWTKRNKAVCDNNQAIFGDDLDVVLVEHPELHTLALVMRESRGQMIWVEQDHDLWLRTDGNVQIGQPVDDAESSKVSGPVEYAQCNSGARIYLQRHGKRPYWTYLAVGVIPVESLDEGEQLIRQMRSAHQMKVARNIDGFGSTPVEPQPKATIIAGFGSKPAIEVVPDSRVGSAETDLAGQDEATVEEWAASRNEG